MRILLRKKLKVFSSQVCFWGKAKLEISQMVRKLIKKLFMNFYIHWKLETAFQSFCPKQVSGGYKINYLQRKRKINFETFSSLKRGFRIFWYTFFIKQKNILKHSNVPLRQYSTKYTISIWQCRIKKFNLSKTSAHGDIRWMDWRQCVWYLQVLLVKNVSKQWFKSIIINYHRHLSRIPTNGEGYYVLGKTR